MSYMSRHNHGCRLTEVVIQGLRALFLENELLRIGVLIDKGTDVFEFVHKPTDTDFLLRHASGIRNPATFVPTKPSSKGNVTDYWVGGWFEMFPNAGYSCTYRGAELGDHGDASLMPWQWRVLADSPDEISVAFDMHSYRLPLGLEKRLTLRSGRATLDVWERVTNDSGEEIDFSWGHHPTFGGAFLCAECMIDVPPCMVCTADWDVDETSRLAKGVDVPWPHVPSRGGGMVDLSRVAPRETSTHDLVALHGFDEGWYAITNTVRGVGFAMRWDPLVFPWLWYWQPWGGTTGWPWFRSLYTCGLEPVTTFPPVLTDAIARGTQRRLAPLQSLDTRFFAMAYSGAERVRGISVDGQILRV